MRLSVYCDLRRIGWVVTDVSHSIIARGIKRVNIDFDNYYEFIAGLPISKRTNRRNKRTARRNLWRYKSRRERLTGYLQKLDMVQQREYSYNEMLKLRVRALTDKLTQSELAAVFLSLQRKRGYKSQRGLANSETSDYLAEIKRHEENLTKYRSIAEYLLNEHPDTAHNIIFQRAKYEEEFNAICAAQGINDKNLFNIIYFQRPLARGKVAYCPLEHNRHVCHYSHPDYQRFRILRDVNNISIQDINFDDVQISHTQRMAWVIRLMDGKNLTKAMCCKDLGIKRSTGYVWRSGKQIEGNIVIRTIGDNSELWQDLFAAKDDAALRQLLIHKYGATGEQLDKLVDVDFNAAGWGEYCHKAIMRLIPIMEQGITLKEAILEVYGTVDFTDKPSLRNLIVEQHYDSYCSLIETIKKNYDITETAVEIGYLLKAGNKSRKAIAKRRRIREKRSDSFTDYQRVLIDLWEEFGKMSPYEPGKQITQEELLTNYNIDHIVPKSKIFEHGAVNQCICRKDINEQKGSMTGIDFAESIGILDEYTRFIEDAKISEQKKRYLFMRPADIPRDLLNTEDYITRCFATKADFILPNKIINKYYRQWGYDVYPDNDVRQVLMKAILMANFDKSAIDYFNNLQDLPITSIGRYKIEPSIAGVRESVLTVIPYIPRPKYYRRTKIGITPRMQLHDESNYGVRKEFIREKGKLFAEENTFYKVRKPVGSLTPAMISKIMDNHIKQLFTEYLNGRDHAEAIKELAEHPLFFNKKPIKSVSIRVNALNLIKLDRGYVYPSMNWGLNLTTFDVVNIHEYIKNLNNGKMQQGHFLKKNDIVKYAGKYYFAVGATEPSSLKLRSVYELNAVSIQGSKKMLSECKIIRINQIGEITNGITTD